MPNVSRSLSDDRLHDDVEDPQDHGPSAISRLRSLLAEQNQHLDRLRWAIARIGHSLAEIDSEAEDREGGLSRAALLKAQSEAIQGLTLLAIKGQHLQAETLAVLELLADSPPARDAPNWALPAVGFSVLLSLLALLL